MSIRCRYCRCSLTKSWSDDNSTGAAGGRLCRLCGAWLGSVAAGLLLRPDIVLYDDFHVVSDWWLCCFCGKWRAHACLPLRILGYIVVYCMFVSHCRIVLLSVVFYLWPPYVIGGPLYFCPVISIVYRLSFFPRLISAATDWISTVLLHMAWP